VSKRTQHAWSEEEIATLKEAWEQKPEGQSMRSFSGEVAEVLGRSPTSVLGKLYGVMGKKQSPRSKSQDKRTPLPVRIAQLQHQLQAMQEELSDLKQESKIIEDWVEQTLRIKERYTVTADSNGIVHRVEKQE